MTIFVSFCTILHEMSWYKNNNLKKNSFSAAPVPILSPAKNNRKHRNLSGPYTFTCWQVWKVRRQARVVVPAPRRRRRRRRVVVACRRCCSCWCCCLQLTSRVRCPAACLPFLRPAPSVAAAAAPWHRPRHGQTTSSAAARLRPRLSACFRPAGPAWTTPRSDGLGSCPETPSLCRRWKPLSWWRRVAARSGRGGALESARSGVDGRLATARWRRHKAVKVCPTSCLSESTCSAQVDTLDPASITAHNTTYSGSIYRIYDDRPLSFGFFVVKWLVS